MSCFNDIPVDEHVALDLVKHIHVVQHDAPEGCKYSAPGDYTHAIAAASRQQSKDSTNNLFSIHFPHL